MSKLQRWLRCVGPYSRYDGCNVKNITGGLLVLNRLSPKDIKFLNILAKTPEGKSALDEYIEQHEKAVKAYKIYRESVVAEVEVEKVVKPVEPKRKFKTGDKVRVLVEDCTDASTELKVGEITTVVGYKQDDEYWLRFYNCFGPKSRIGERPVVTEKCRGDGKEYFSESALELVEEKTPNELRAEIIQRAKDTLSVWKWKNNLRHHNGYRNLELPKPYNRWLMVAEFVVNEEKRTVVALLKGYVDVATKGIAKCHPSDVFNEHIGKAIALGRALGKDVSEFENAVQPTEPVVGHVVKGYEALGFYRQDRKFTLTSKKDCDSFYYPECSEYSPGNHDDFICNWQMGAIINDTNAQYKNL